MSMFWLGQTMWIGAPVFNGGDPDTVHFSTNLDSIDDGDVIERLLVSYHLMTPLVDNTSGVQVQPLPVFVGVSYTPNPNDPPEPSSFTAAQMVFGDALFSDMCRWKPVYGTDGTFHWTQWTADSDGIVTVQGRRTITNKEDGLINIGIHIAGDDFGGSEINSGDFGVSGMVYVKFLFRRLLGA